MSQYASTFPQKLLYRRLMHALHCSLALCSGLSGQARSGGQSRCCASASMCRTPSRGARHLPRAPRSSRATSWRYPTQLRRLPPASCRARRPWKLLRSCPDPPSLPQRWRRQLQWTAKPWQTASWRPSRMGPVSLQSRMHLLQVILADHCADFLCPGSLRLCDSDAHCMQQLTTTLLGPHWRPDRFDSATNKILNNAPSLHAETPCSVFTCVCRAAASARAAPAAGAGQRFCYALSAEAHRPVQGHL